MKISRVMMCLILCGLVAVDEVREARGEQNAPGRQLREAKKRKRVGNPRRRFTPPPDVEMRRDVVYGKGGGRDLKLDLFLPKKGSGQRPAIVFIHGGGWRGGRRGQFYRQAAYLASKGYIGACIEYRLSGEAAYPAAVEDCKCAVRWLRANAKKLSVDMNRIAACGGSAGGHLASLIGVTEGAEELEGKGGHAEFSSKINLVVSFNGVADMSLGKDKPVTNAIARFLGGSYEDKQDVYEKASPITHVDTSSPPFLFLHGTADKTVPFEQSQRMLKKLQAAGVPAEIYVAEEAGHAFFNRPPHYDPTLKRMEQFLDKHFRSKKADD